MRSRAVFSFLLLVVSSARAATYLVGSDRDLIRSSSAIVIVTAGESQSMRAPRGTIETSTRMHVEEAIAGPLRAGNDVDVVELGGIIDGHGLAIAGAPRFATGERMLLLLDRDADAAWTTRAMALGRFTFARDVNGHDVLVRDEVFGFDTNWQVHREPRRDAAKFLAFVRETANGGDPPADYFMARAPLAKTTDALEPNASFAASTYTLQSNGRGMRWNTFPTPTTFFSYGTQPGAVNGGLTAAQKGLSVWTGNATSNIRYEYGGTTTVHGGFQGPDGVNTILFNDPNKEIQGSFTGVNGDVLAIGGAWAGPATHTFNGETFYTITEADLIVQDGIFGSGLIGNGFDHVLAHELGHTLGLRHSDRTPDDQSPCNPAVMECTADALMDSGVNFNADPFGAALHQWDQDAAGAVYGSGGGNPPPPTCIPPSIVTQPVSADYHNADVALTVVANGTTPLNYQWYIGSTGDVRFPTGTNAATLVVSSLAQTTNYWVRVTGQCSPPADSTTATITVNGCPGVAITNVTADTTIIQGRPQTLSASVSGNGHPLTYQWFAGPIGDKSRPLGTTSSVTITPQSTQTYWLLVTNDCGASATSEPVTITVTPCDAPKVIIQPANAEALAGNSATLAATIAGTAPMQLQWYEGQRGDLSKPVTNATTASFTTDALSAATSYWLDANNPCGEVQTNAAAVTIVNTCTPPVITVQPRDTAVAAGTSAILSVGATGPSLTYAWYQGPVFDFTHPVGRSAPSIATPPITAATQFWVRITNPCSGPGVDSVAVTVKPATGRRRAVKQ